MLTPEADLESTPLSSADIVDADSTRRRENDGHSVFHAKPRPGSEPIVIPLQSHHSAS